MKPATLSRESAVLLNSPRYAALFDKVRIATLTPEPPPAPRRPLFKAAHAWAVMIVLACLFTGWCHSGSRSASIVLSTPLGVTAENSVTGSTLSYGGDFRPVETLLALQQIDWLKGTPPASHFLKLHLDDVRLTYAVLANLLTFGLSAPYALQAFNLLLFALCAGLVAAATRTLFDDGAKSLLAAVLFVLSVAATVHVGELSPRFLGIACYYLWTVLLLKVETQGVPVTWRTTIGLSSLLGAWSLVSPEATLGLAVYALFLFNRGKLPHLLLPTIAWVAFPRLEQFVIARFGGGFTAGLGAEPVWRALEMHRFHFSGDPLAYLSYLATECLNLLFDDNPINVVIGVIGLVFLRHKAKRLLAVCYLVPIGVTLFLLPTTNMRGCAVVCNTIVLFPIVAHVALEGSRRLSRRLGPMLGPSLALVPVVLLLAVQGVWGHASLAGWRYPSNAYAAGMFQQAGMLLPADVSPMTGPAARKPGSVGGAIAAAEFLRLGSDLRQPSIIPDRRLARYRNNWAGWQTLLGPLAIQSPILGSLFVAVLFLGRRRWNLCLLPIFLGAVVASQICGAARGFDPRAVQKFHDRIVLREDERLVGGIQFSQEFRESLEEAAARNLSVEAVSIVRARDFQLNDEPLDRSPQERPAVLDAEFAQWQSPSNGSPRRTSAEFRVDEWTTDEGRLTIPARDFLAALEAHQGRVEFSISPQAGCRELWVHSWQAIGQGDGRDASVVRADGVRKPIRWFPTFEIRIPRRKRADSVATLIGRYAASRQTGYELIGF